jgi:hypothetical protein
MADRANDLGPPPGLPRWVTVTAIIAAAVVLVVVAILLTVGGDHGPSRHTPENEPAEIEAPGGHAPPDGGHG